LVFSRHSHGSGPVHYASEAGGIVFELYPLTPKSNPTTGTRIGFRVDDVDSYGLQLKRGRREPTAVWRWHSLARENQLDSVSIVEMLSQIGAEIITPPKDSEWGRRAVVRDLDGHVVEIVATKGEQPVGR
jgi:hypothetical protein